MADTAKCFALIRGRAIRVTRLDGCGAPVLGPDSQVVSDGFISVALTANTDEGTAIAVTNAAGKVCIADTPAPKFTGYAVTVEFCGVNPDLIALMTGQEKVLDSDDLPVGFKMSSDIDADESGFALEMWSNVPAAVCEPGGSGGAQYGYFLVPFLKGGVLGDFTIGNDAVNFTLSGANSKDGNGWGSGPYNVVPDGTGAPAELLEALEANDHLLMQLTDVPPPDTDDCGAQALGVPATSAIAGTPGSYSPANSYGRESVATATGLTASPATSWTTGQYVRNRDGSLMHWSGTAWTAGAKP